MNSRLRRVLGVVMLFGGLFILGRLGSERIASFMQSTLGLIMMVTVLAIVAFLFLYDDGPYLWRWWFPNQPVGPTVKRWLRYLLQAFTAGVAYVEVRGYINRLTEVDPGNFPTALTALSVFAALYVWLVTGLLAVFLWSFMCALTAAKRAITGFWREQTQTDSQDMPIGGWERRFFGILALPLVVATLYFTVYENPWMQRAVRSFVTGVIVATEFSYDRTCAVSSKERLVARLKDFKEWRTSMVSIVEGGPFRETSFTTGTCDQAIQGSYNHRLMHNSPDPG